MGVYAPRLDMKVLCARGDWTRHLGCLVLEWNLDTHHMIIRMFVPDLELVLKVYIYFEVLKKTLLVVLLQFVRTLQLD